MKNRIWCEKPKLLILYEKHGEAYYHIANDEALFATALMILTGRLNSTYWYYNPSDEKPEAPAELTTEALEKLPTSLQAEGKKLLARYKRELCDWQENMETFAMIQKAVSDKDGQLAWQVLQERSDHEYERVELTRYHEKYG